MLTQAADYRYCTPIAAGIKGSVLPMVDGTAAARVNRYEDVAFLVEAVRERYDWDYGRPGGRKLYVYDSDGTPSVIPDFERCGIVARRHSPLDNLVDTISNGLPTINQYAPTFAASAYSIAAANWDNGPTGSSFPVISIPDPGEFLPAQSSFDLLFANAAIARDSASIATVPRIVEGDTLRAMYSDIAKMRRFVFHEEPNPLHNVPFDDTTFNARFESWMVALQTDERSSLTTPRLGWQAPTESYPDGRFFNSYPGSLTFYIRKPFVVNALTQAQYYSTGTAYPIFQLTYTTKDDQDNFYFWQTSAIFRIVNASVSPVSAVNFEGSFTIDMPASRMEGYIGLIMQKLQQSSLVPGRVQTIGITFDGICFDTGNIALPSTVPDSA